MGCAAGIPVHPHHAQQQGPNSHQLDRTAAKAKLLSLAKQGPNPSQKPRFAIESSWNSATWNVDVPPGVPRPPNRILHEMHLKVMDSFRKDVELAPGVFSDIVTSRRQTSEDQVVAAQF